MKKILLVGAIALASATLATSANASDGTITFTGKVVGTTCTINGGTSDFTVTLPTVSTSALASTGAVAGRTPFQINLTGCQGEESIVSVHFESGSLTEDGKLIVSPGDDAAENVVVGLLNNQHNRIVVGDKPGNQGSQAVTIANGAATLNYFAEYEAVGSVVAGDVNTQVLYSLIYQ